MIVFQFRSSSRCFLGLWFVIWIFGFIFMLMFSLTYSCPSCASDIHGEAYATVHCPVCNVTYATYFEIFDILTGEARYGISGPLETPTAESSST